LLNRTNVRNSCEKLEEKVFINTKIRKNLNSKVNDLFAVKRSSSIEKMDIKKGLSIKSDEESYLVDNTVEISNLELLQDFSAVVVF